MFKGKKPSIMSSRLVALDDSTKEVCQFCGFDEIDTIKYGPMYKLDDVVAHYYCILLSHKMQQRGEDDQGILGFLLPDIRAEFKRAGKINCTYCGRHRASLQCSNKRCKIKFHLPCGLKNGSMHQFMKQFLSFCIQHRPEQDVPLKALQEAKDYPPICLICQEGVDFQSLTEAIWAPCCSKTWYHRICVQQLANSAGYFFKCANCNNNEKFRNWVLQYGIFIPEQDASWELEPNAFGDLLSRYNRCDAEDCRCPGGRNENAEKTRWEIILCDSCGSQGMHIACGRLKFHNPLWECTMCTNVPGANSELTGNISSDTSTSEISVDSASSSRSTRRSMGRRRKQRSRSLDDKSKRRYRIYLPSRRMLRARQLRNRIAMPKDESSCDSSGDKKPLHSRNYESSSSLVENPSSSASSEFSRRDKTRMSEPRIKRKRPIKENLELGESTKKSKHDYSFRKNRNKDKDVSDENVKPDGNSNSKLQELINYYERTKDRAQSTSSSASDVENNSSSKDSSALGKQDARSKTKTITIKRTSSDNLSEAFTKLKAGPLSYKLKQLKKAVGGPETDDDDDIEVLPTPQKDSIIVEIIDSSEDEQKTETEDEITVVNLSQQDVMYRVKKEVVEESDEDCVEVADLSPEADKHTSEEESNADCLDKNLLSGVYGSKFKVVEESLKAPIIVVKTEMEVQDIESEKESDMEIENVEEVTETEKIIEASCSKKLPVETEKIKEKTPENELVMEKPVTPMISEMRNTIKKKIDSKIKDIGKIDDSKQAANDTTNKVEDPLKIKESPKKPEPGKGEASKNEEKSQELKFEGKIDAKPVVVGSVWEHKGQFFKLSEFGGEIKLVKVETTSDTEKEEAEKSGLTLADLLSTPPVNPSPNIPPMVPVTAPAQVPITAAVGVSSPHVPSTYTAPLPAQTFVPSAPPSSATTGSYFPPRTGPNPAVRKSADFAQYTNYPPSPNVKSHPPPQYHSNYYQQRHSSYYPASNPAPSAPYSQPVPTPPTASLTYASSASLSESWPPQRPRLPSNNPGYRPPNQYANLPLSNFEVVGSIDPLNSQYSNVPQSTPTKNPQGGVASQSSGYVPPQPHYSTAAQQHQPQYSQPNYSGSAQRSYSGATQQSYSGGSQQLYPGGSQQSYSGATQQTYSGGSQQPYSGAAQHSYSGAPQQPYSGAAQQPYSGAAQQSYSGARQPYSSHQSYAAPQYSRSSQSAQFSTSSQQPFLGPSQQSQYSAPPQQSQYSVIPSQQDAPTPIISSVCSLSSEAYETADSNPNFNRSPNKPPNERKATFEKNTPRKQNFHSRGPVTPPRMMAPRQRYPAPPYRMQQSNPRKVAAVKPSAHITNDVSSPQSNDGEEIQVLEVTKPPPLKTVRGLPNRAITTNKKAAVKEVIELD